MKTAWAWLAAGVVALGLNGFYQDGGAQWLHQRVGLAGHRTEAVLALATGHVDRFLAEARLVAAQQSSVRCPFAAMTAVAEPVHVYIRRIMSDSARADFDAGCDRGLARVERARALDRARLDLQLARMDAASARLQAQWGRSSASAMVLHPMVVRVPAVRLQDLPQTAYCSRLNTKIPQVPALKIPAVPMVRIQKLSFGSI